LQRSGGPRSRAAVVAEAEAIKLCSANLEKIKEAAPSVEMPAYDRSKITPGIVHMGVGNFHRGHQAVFTDDILGIEGQEGWGYAGLGIRAGSAKIRDVLKGQDHLFAVWQKGLESSKPRVIGCHSMFVMAPEAPDDAVALLSKPETKIITLTVTEKGYFVDFATGKLDVTNPDVIADIAALKEGSNKLKTPPGFIIAAAKKRAAAGVGGFAVLSCDNVPENGVTVGTAVTEMAEAADAETAAWIKKECTFPNSMVDRIVPSTTEDFTKELADTHKIEDGWPILSEEFNLWVIEDKFPQGRPAWEKTKTGQCLFVKDVVPYELMKLRLLNSAHQAMAYPGALLGYKYVHDAMADPLIDNFMVKYGAAAARTVPPVEGIDKDAWTTDVINRFKNPNVADTIYRLNEDATNRIAVALAPMLEDKAAVGGESLTDAEVAVIQLPVACWIRSIMEGESDGAGALPELAKLNRDDKRESVTPAASAAWAAADEASAAAFLTAAFGEAKAKPAAAKALAENIKLLKEGGAKKLLEAVNAK
jgi:mannitol 2-dehydrogenase